MLPRMPRKVRLILLAIFLACTPRFFTGQATAPVRYHFGDNPAWSDPSFDDSSWLVAQNGRWPTAPFYSDGFAWVRVRVPVPSDAAGPLAIRDAESVVASIEVLYAARDLFVNGLPVRRQGSFPPQVDLHLFGRDSVFDLPPGVAEPGKTAVVALRVWYPPFLRLSGDSGGEAFAIDASRILRLASHSDYIAAVLAGGPDLVLNAAIAILGIGLLIFWRWAGGRELLLCSAMLILYPLFDALGGLTDLGLVGWPWRVDPLIWSVLRCTAMIVTIEFLWAIHGLRSPAVKRLVQAAIVIRNAAPLIANLATTASPIVLWSLLAIKPAGVLLDCIIVAVNLWAFFVKKRNRLIAAAMATIPVVSLIGRFSGRVDSKIGPIHADYFNVAYFFAAIALFIMLGQRAWLAWRARDELRSELEAAREVQQQLVSPAGDLPGFRIESAYEPAKQVGGDFFRVIPEGESGVLIVIGDVSGKGLRAAMTVSSIIGALRSIPPVSPAWILNALNYGLAGNLQGGFVTCCAARITHDGTVTFANAGHLSPYLNGAEVDVSAGLPLGIAPEIEYEESHFELKPGEALTFVSDGVVEARNPSGELFGFERTLRISASRPDAIAQAAKDFGQDDDITVLALTRLAEVNR